MGQLCLYSCQAFITSQSKFYVPYQDNGIITQNYIKITLQTITQLIMSEEIQAHILTRFKVMKKIGSGAYGHVFKVVDRRNKQIKALKKNFDAFNNSTDAQRTYRQIMFLMQLKHPNIVVLQEVIRAQNGKDIYLLFEHLDIDLYTLIREGILAQKHKKYILYQTAKSMLYLHSAGLIHRDLKPSNILVNQSCDAKLCDFGLVRSIDDKNMADDKLDILTEYIATRWYRAPEILLGSRTYSKGIDIWSFGCLVAELFKGKPLFPGTSTTNQIQRVLIWTGVPTKDDIQSLGISCGKQIFDLFPTIRKINKRQLFNEIDPDCLDLICKTLEFNPNKRISIQEIITHPYLREFYEPEALAVSSKNIRLPVDDNRRLSLKDYRALIYQQIRKKNKNTLPSFHGLLNDTTLYRIRQKPKKSIRTQESDNQLEPKGQIQREQINKSIKKRNSNNYENQSKTVSIKHTDNYRKRSTPYKGESLYSKNLKTVDQQWDRAPMDTKKMAIFKEHNKTTKQNWNKAKRSVTEGDARKKSKLLATQAQMEAVMYYKK